MQPPAAGARRGPAYCRNSCFLDALVVALLHRPAGTLLARLRAEAPAHPVAQELCALMHFIHARDAPAPAMTCTTLRRRLLAEMQRRGYENPADGQPRDATEMLKALLEILRVPDTLRVTRRAQIQLAGGGARWLDRDADGGSGPVPHGTVWTAHLPSTARTVGQALHISEEQEVEGRLDAEDMDAMARLHGAPLPTARYVRRRDVTKVVGVEGDLFCVELGRVYLDRAGRARRASAAFAPDAILLGGRAFHVLSVVCHASRHYTCVVRRGGAWWEYDDRAPARLQPCALTADKLRTAVLYVYGTAPHG